MQTPYTIYACESQPVVIEGLLRVFEREEDLSLIGHSPLIDEAMHNALRQQIDVLILGQQPTTRSALPLLSQVRDAQFTAGAVLWVGELSEMDAFRALQMGARWVVLRTQPVSVLLECLRAVARGTIWLEGASRRAESANASRGVALRLTRREREIIECVCRGLKNKDIAEQLQITAGTVKVHLMHIFEKTGAKDRFQLALQGRPLLDAANDAAKLTAAVGD